MSEAPKTNLLGLTRTQIEAFFVGLDAKPFHGRNVLKWIHKHGVSDFDIRSGNTLHEPALIEGNCLKTFDVVPPIRRTPSRSGTARRGRAINGIATSSAPRRRAAPTTPSCSTSCRAWTRRALAI